VAVDGTVPISYQWLKNGMPITGATNVTLTITNAQLADDARYSVVAVNALDSVTSDEARLTVVPFLNLSAAPVQASSEFPGGFLARGAFDRLKLSTGPNTARWASAPSGAPHWIYVDLGRDLAIRRVTADFDPACAAEFFVRYRTEAEGATSNPTEWTAMASVSGYAQAGQGIDGPDVFFDFLESRVDMPGNVAPSAITTISPDMVVARYLMLHVTATASGFMHVSVWEFQIDAISSEARIQSVVLAGNGATINFSGIPQRNYEVQRAPTLGGSWETLTTVPASNDGSAEFLDTQPTQPMSFYRLFAP
jgi:hypothetical protein